MSLLYSFYKYCPSRVKKRMEYLIAKNEGGFMFSGTIRRIYKERYNIEIGYGTYGGCFNSANIPGNVRIGNYCSFAKNVKIFRANHPKEKFTTHPILYNPKVGFVKTDLLDRPKLEIGHDVWVGDNVVILSGVNNIGTGAIIGAGSIVTKDVEAYAIVVGNPAKEISKRFNKDVIESLLKSKWWEFDKNELVSKVKELNTVVEGK